MFKPGTLQIKSSKENLFNAFKYNERYTDKHLIFVRVYVDIEQD